MILEEISHLPFLEDAPINVQLRIDSNGNNYVAYIKADWSNWYRFSIGINRDDLDEINQELQQAIEQISGHFEEEGITDNVLSLLRKKGNFAFNSIFANGSPRETLRKVLSAGATIQISSEDFFLPWELLYDGPLDSRVNASRFWGMRYNVSRALIQEARPGDLVSPIIKTACPLVGLIACNELEYVVRKEIPTLQELQQQNRILLIPLRPLDTNQHYEELVHFGRFLREKELHIIHLACHAYSKKHKSQSYLLISNDFDISIQDFGVQEFVIEHNPFVILNACLTGTMSPLSTFNWAALFLRHGARGVLATEMRVPDSFAANFMGEMYQCFLSGMPIGEALLTTRRYFWEEQSNPLGLAYTLYSSPAIRITGTNLPKEAEGEKTVMV